MKYTVAIILLLFLFQPGYGQSPVKDETVYRDKDFMQEYNENYPVGNTAEENNTRSIAVDKNATVWIATAKGVMMKKDGETDWKPLPFSDEDKGPAYSVAVDDLSAVWMGTWNAVFSFRNGALKKIPGTQGPISLICNSREGVYAIGPNGIW